jgi:hypothetical protein
MEFRNSRALCRLSEPLSPSIIDSKSSIIKDAPIITTPIKLHAGNKFPDITVTCLYHGEVTLGKAAEGTEWQMIVVYTRAPLPSLHETSKPVGTF